MDTNAERQLPVQLDGQTSINDYLTPAPAITPVELREPTDIELADYLKEQSAND